MQHVVIVTSHFESMNGADVSRHTKVQTLDCISRAQAEGFAKALRDVSPIARIDISPDMALFQTFEPGVVFYIGKKHQKVVAASDELSYMVGELERAMQD